MNRSGYIIILRPDLDNKKYEIADIMQRNLEYVGRLRKLLDFIEPSKYRGTGREFFTSNPYYIDKTGELFTYPEVQLNGFDSLKARERFAEIEYMEATADELDRTFFTLDQMQRAYALLDNKDNYEIIEFIENEIATNSKTLGFDVGYLASDYSVIADTAIKPTWHPPDFEDMQDIIEHLKKLNEHCLFPTFQDAKDYRESYLKKNWGEKEMYYGQITTIQIRMA